MRLQNTVYQNEKDGIDKIIEQVFDIMTEFVSEKMEKLKQKKTFYKNFKKIGNFTETNNNSQVEKDYENLEKMTQKYEQDIRSHISIEQ